MKRVRDQVEVAGELFHLAYLIAANSRARPVAMAPPHLPLAEVVDQDRPSLSGKRVLMRRLDHMLWVLEDLNVRGVKFLPGPVRRDLNALLAECGSDQRFRLVQRALGHVFELQVRYMTGGPDGE